MKKLLTLVIVLLVLLIAVPVSAAPAILVVDDDGTYDAATNTCDGTDAAYTNIQGAVNAAATGDTVLVCPGTYNEAVVIDGKDVSLLAVSSVTIVPISPCPGHGDVIQVYNAVATIDGFTIDANYAQTGCLGGIYVRSMDMWSEGPATAVISNNTVSNYGKNGITVNGSGATATVLDNTVQGRGPIGLGDWAQNGIQFGYGAKGVGRGNTVTDHYYAGPGWYATGILLFDVYAVDVKTSQNMFRNNQRNLSLLTDQACPHQFGGVYDEWDLCSYY